MRLFFALALSLSFLTCEIAVEKQTCIFGPWKVSQITGPDGSVLPEIKLSTNFPLLKDSTNLDFFKSNELVFEQTADTIQFKYDDKGITFKGVPEDLFATVVRVEGDSMVLNIQQNTITFKRPEN